VDGAGREVQLNSMHTVLFLIDSAEAAKSGESGDGGELAG
jgi:hypothetical protein